MRVRRLGWAGVEIEQEDEVLVIDLLEERRPLGEALALEQALPAASHPARTDAALVTHLHADHTDPAALRRALREGAPVLGPPAGRGPFAQDSGTSAIEASLGFHGLAVEQVEDWETREIGAFRVTAVPAVDGLGDPQVSWVVEAGGTRILHGGDTMAHGLWWGIRAFVGLIDLALLPINGPVLEAVPGRAPSSPFPAVLLPEQAASAAHILGARRVVPIHYGLDAPPLYTQTPDALERFERATAELGIEAIVLEPGQAITI